ncbi:flagellar protein FliT [Aquibacillus halophilus]|uniref:Flagellar protein FliT n=2 Tax=Aquibacillus halophilus TaxID=930132 RepID=A0A6A8D9M9_9BACI|nr:flagellar protein FliT [Aquibacillus halophilus]
MDRLSEITNELHQVVTHSITSENRQETIDEISDLLEKRQQLLEEIKPPYTEKEKEVGQSLLPKNQEIQVRLESIFTQVKNDMGALKKKKSSNTKYTNPYQNLSNFDGMFLDHKK